MPFGTEMILLGLTVLMFFVVWFVVKNIYVNKKKMALEDAQYKGWERLSNKKLFLDEIYNATFVKMTEGLGVGGNMSVSYTHLDVYKRQLRDFIFY